MYRAQSSGVHYPKSAGFWSFLHTDFRFQECAMDRIKDVECAQLRSIKECATQSEHSKESTMYRSKECRTYSVQGSRVCHVQNTEFRDLPCTVCSVQKCATYTVQGSGACYVQSVAFRHALHRVRSCELADSLEKIAFGDGTDHQTQYGI